MSTLFQLNSDINSLKKHVLNILDLATDDDAIICLGATVAFKDWMISYIEEYQHQHGNKLLKLYALHSDIQLLDKLAQENLEFDDNQMDLLTDEQWVELTLEVDKVVSIV